MIKAAHDFSTATESSVRSARTGGRVGPRRVAFFGGGSGGHLYPGLALAECLKARHPACDLTFFRTGRSVEDRVFGSVGLVSETVTMDLSAPTRRSLANLSFGKQCYRSLVEIRRHMFRSHFDVAVGLGGYGSLPGVLAARLSSVPVILMEQNVKPGKANRLLGPIARCVALSNKESQPAFARMVRTCVTGNPLRDLVLRASRWRQERSPEERRVAVDRSGPGEGVEHRRVLLIMGGSQGARAINRFVMDSLGAVQDYRDQIYCVHLSGSADKEAVERSYRKAGWKARVEAFDKNLPMLMASADLVLARAGGTSLSELAAIGVPSVLIPYPGHRDRHQFLNAEVLEKAGAARVFGQEHLTQGDFESVLNLLFRDEELLAMSDAASRHGCLDGAERVVQLMEDIVAEGCEGASRRAEPRYESLNQ